MRFDVSNHMVREVVVEVKPVNLRVKRSDWHSISSHKLSLPLFVYQLHLAPICEEIWQEKVNGPVRDWEAALPWDHVLMDLFELSDLCTPWCIHVVATLRIANRMESGISDIDALSSAANADRESLERVLRHLVSKGVFEESTPGQFILNDGARPLLDEAALLGLDLDGIGGRMAHAWGTLLKAVRTGKPAYRDVFGKDWWDDLDANPKIAESFDALMGPGHGTPDPDVLLNIDDWEKVRTVVDVGGGTGSLLAEVLRAHPNVRGTLIDLPRTVANSHQVFEVAGVADRATAIGQSFFDPLPAGADLYLLKSVLGDWPDAEARMILHRVAEAAKPNGRIVIVNGVTADDVADPDLLMLVLVGGKHRTLKEFRGLARDAGLEVQKVGTRPEIHGGMPVVLITKPDNDSE